MAGVRLVGYIGTVPSRGNTTKESDIHDGNILERIICINTKLLGGFNPFEKYARQNGNLPPSRGENKKYLSCHHLDHLFQYKKTHPKVDWQTSAKVHFLQRTFQLSLGDAKRG